ncbi:MAG: 3-dehydroquinate synthase [Planctomycetes bacterium]|nr:3-dehydroquinate synthase [Planctomycetota bacterium]
MRKQAPEDGKASRDEKPLRDPAPQDAAVYRQRFSVDFDYEVHFTRDVFRKDNPLLLQVLDRKAEGRRHRVFVCVDSGVAEARPGLIREIKDWFHERQAKAELVASPEVIPGGERAKLGWQTVEDLMVAFGNHHLDRQSFVLAIGGGSVLDMVGFAAALVHRGLRLVRLPTTVLAMDDAGIGVKNGMNEHGVKNFLGTFAPPFAVVNDFSFLATLPQEHWLGGVAEAFKVAIIKDLDLLDFLTSHARAIASRDEGVMEQVIRRCAVRHLEHIAGNGDPFEMGTARPLDFGHWSAHKLESLSGFRVSHGAAVAAGICLDSYYAMRKGFIAPPELGRILGAVKECGFKLWHPEMGQRGGSGELAIIEGLEEFREHLGGRLTITLPRPLGRKVEVHHMDLDVVEEGLWYLRDQEAQAAAAG